MTELAGLDLAEGHAPLCEQIVGITEDMGPNERQEALITAVVRLSQRVEELEARLGTGPGSLRG